MSRYLYTKFVNPNRAQMHLTRTFSVIAEAHLGLSKTNCVFPLTNAIELFQLDLVDALPNNMN